MPRIDARARLDFALFARQAWAAQVYPCLVDEVRKRAGALAETSEDLDRWTERVDKVAPFVWQSSIYPFFAWLERGLQKQLWRATSEVVSESPTTLEIDLGDSESDGTLELDGETELPKWYAECDFHLQPGGVWPSLANGEVYKLGAQVVMLGANDQAQFHRLFTDTAIPDRDYRRIVDLGCGFAKSTFPLKQRLPHAEVIGIDLAEPLLKMAWAQARRDGIVVRLRQADCRSTGLDGASADLVTATMLIHELPLYAVEEMLAEVARLLRPGGLLRVLDFHPTGDPLRDLAMMEHSERNNEPFLADLFKADVIKLCGKAGLADARWVAFDERGAGRLNEAVWPKRKEWHFPWAVLEAVRP